MGHSLHSPHEITRKFLVSVHSLVLILVVAIFLTFLGLAIPGLKIALIVGSFIIGVYALILVVWIWYQLH